MPHVVAHQRTGRKEDRTGQKVWQCTPPMCAEGNGGIHAAIRLRRRSCGDQEGAGRCGGRVRLSPGAIARVFCCPSMRLVSQQSTCPGSAAIGKFGKKSQWAHSLAVLEGRGCWGRNELLQSSCIRTTVRGMQHQRLSPNDVVKLGRKWSVLRLANGVFGNFRGFGVFSFQYSHVLTLHGVSEVSHAQKRPSLSAGWLFLLVINHGSHTAQEPCLRYNSAITACGAQRWRLVMDVLEKGRGPSDKAASKMSSKLISPLHSSTTGRSRVGRILRLYMLDPPTKGIEMPKAGTSRYLAAETFESLGTRPCLPARAQPGLLAIGAVSKVHRRAA